MKPQSVVVKTAKNEIFPCSGWFFALCWLICAHNAPFTPSGGYRRQPLQNVWLIGSRRCIGSGSAAMCPWCRCSAARKHDIAVLIAIVRTAEIKPPVYQFAQSSAPKFVHRMKISTIGNNT